MNHEFRKGYILKSIESLFLSCYQNKGFENKNSRLLNYLLHIFGIVPIVFYMIFMILCIQCSAAIKTLNYWLLSNMFLFYIVFKLMCNGRLIEHIQGAASNKTLILSQQ